MKTKIFLVIALFGLITLASCKKMDVFPDSDTGNSDTLSDSFKPSSSGNFTCPQPYDPDDGTFTYLIKKAKTVKDIPSRFFKLASAYKYSYKHVKQYDGYSCSWTSYTIGVGCVANVYYCYPVTVDQVKYVRKRCINLGGDEQEAKLVTTLRDFNRRYDRSIYVNVAVYTPSQRFEAMKKMLLHITLNHSPFLVVSTYYGSSGKQGHYLIVHSIDWKCGFSGSKVYYSDCSSSNGPSLESNLKTMDFVAFLDRMIDYPDNYNILTITP